MAASAFQHFIMREDTEQGMFEARLRYFTPLMKAGGSKIRTFVNLYYTRGFNSYTDEYLYLRNNDFIRGFRNDSIGGDNRLVFSLEPVCLSLRLWSASGSPFLHLLMPEF